MPVICLVGPKGAGKSTLCRLAVETNPSDATAVDAEVRLVHGAYPPLVPFLQAIFLSLRSSAPEDRWVADGFAAVEQAVLKAAEQHKFVFFDTTGTAPESRSMLRRLSEKVHLVLIRIDTPLDVCLERIAERDASAHIPVPDTQTRLMHALSSFVRLDFAATLENGRGTSLTTLLAELLAIYKGHIAPLPEEHQKSISARKWSFDEKSPRVLITGASGQLGRALMQAFKDRTAAAGGAGEEQGGVERKRVRWDVVGTAYSRAGDGSGLIPLDLRDGKMMAAAVASLAPRVIIHAAAERFPDKFAKEPEASMKLNVDATRQLAQAAKAAKAWLLYISTDYVFDGTSPPYRPGDKTCPVNLYGKSKAQGEEAVMQELGAEGAAVLRVPVLYGQVTSVSESAVAVIADAVAAREVPAKMDDWAIRYPTHVEDVAAACRQMAEAKISRPSAFLSAHPSQIFHFSGDEPLTKMQMAAVMSRVLSLSIDHLSADRSPPGPGAVARPKDCRLDCSDLVRALSIPKLRLTPFEKGIARALEPFAAKLRQRHAMTVTVPPS